MRVSPALLTIVFSFSILSGLLACQPEHQIGDDCDASTNMCETPATALKREKAIRNVDILFVVEKSKSLVQQQVKLAAEIPRLVSALVTGYLNGKKELGQPASSVHLGLVTSDLGLPGVEGADFPDWACFGEGDDGILQHKADPSLSSGCLEDYPPYLEHTGKTDPNITAADFGCMLQVSPYGCPFKMPLEAALKALWSSEKREVTFLGDTQGHGDKENAGFLRTDSLLAVVVVSDEDDCSAGAQGNLAFLSKPGSPSLPEWLASDSDKGDKPGLRCYYDNELPAAGRNRYPVERYLNGFRALDPGREEDRVIFAVIGGVPVDLVGQGSDLPESILGDTRQGSLELVSYYGAILDDPRMIEREVVTDPPEGGYLMKACPDPYATEGEAGIAADPARRLVRLAQNFGVNGVVQSICEERLTSPIERLARALINRLKVSASK
jgi:hypothetical protein